MWSEAIILFKLQFKNKILCTVIIVLHLETLAGTYCIHSLYPALRELHHLLSCSLSLLLQTSQKHLERAAGCLQSWHIWAVFKVKSLYLLLGEERGFIIKGNKWDAWQLMIQRDGSHACQALTSLRRKRLQNEKSGWFIFLVTMRWPLEDLEAQKWGKQALLPLDITEQAEEKLTGLHPTHRAEAPWDAGRGPWRRTSFSGTSSHSCCYSKNRCEVFLHIWKGRRAMKGKEYWQDGPVVA